LSFTDKPYWTLILRLIGEFVFGAKRKRKWSRQFHTTCKKRLGQFPESCPIAPESEDLGFAIRQLVIGRYRALFVVEGDTVEILYVRGSYVGSMTDEPDNEE
jgi:hypothetical protein